MKNCVSLSFLLLCMLFCTKVFAIEVTINGIRYSLSGTVATVCAKQNDSTLPVNLVIPSTIEYDSQTFTVTDIQGTAFTRSNIETVIIEANCKSIGSFAFGGCTKLKWIDFGKGLTSIESMAFYDCLSLTYLVFPKTLKTIGGDSFKGCDRIQSVIYLGNYVSTGLINVNTYQPSNFLKWNSHMFRYTGDVPSVAYSNNLPAGFVPTTVDFQQLNRNVGSYSILVPATFANSDMSFDAMIPYNYAIDKATLKGVVSDVSRVYGEENPPFHVEFSGFVNGEDESLFETELVTDATRTSDVGKYSITCYIYQSRSVSGHIVYDDVKNYELECKRGTLTVTPASLNVIVANAERTYGQNNSTFELNYSGLKNDEIAPEWTEEPIFTTEASPSSSVGKYMINVTCKPKNYEATIESGTLSVTPAPLTIKAYDATRLYCDEAPAYTFSCKGLVNDETSDVLTKQPVMETDATPASNVGVYTITPHGAEAENYAIDYETGKLTISQRPLIVKAASVTRSYGEDNPEFALTYEGFVNGETERVLNPIPIAKSTATAKSNVGVYDITVDGGRAFNYALKYESGTLTVTPKALSVAAGDYERAYNEENPEFRLTYSGFAADDSEASLVSCPTAKTQATKTSNVGTYPVEVSGGYSPNYTFEYIPGTLTINKAEQTLEWEQDLSQLRVNDQVELQAHASSGLPVTYQMEPNDFVELYPAGSRSYLECRTPGSFWINAVQNGNDNYYPSQRISKEVNIIGTKKDSLLLTIRQADNGTVSTWVAKNSSWQFKIAATDGWIIHSVTFNDVDVTGQLDNEGIFAAPAITSNSILSIVYEKEVDESVRTAKTSRIKVQSTSFGARVTGTDVGDIIQVYSVDGVQHRTVQAIGAMTDVVLESGNVYILKVGDNTVKFSH